MLRESTLSTGGFKLNLAVGQASGPPLVLFHGVTRRWQDYATLLPVLAMRWHVHAPDFRGHGLSDRRTNGYLVIDYMQDALTLLATLAQPAVLFGHSLGAMVAVAAAAAKPEQVKAVILEDPPFDTLAA